MPLGRAASLLLWAAVASETTTAFQPVTILASSLPPKQRLALPLYESTATSNVGLDLPSMDDNTEDNDGKMRLVDSSSLVVDDASGIMTASTIPPLVAAVIPQSTTTTTGTATPSSSTDTLSLWKRRLITHEDPLSLHKWSSFLYSVSSFLILATAASRYGQDVFFGTHLFAELPTQWLQPWAMLFTGSNLIMCTASVKMSLEHRKGDLTARNAFLGTALSSLFSGFFFLWISPWGDALFANQNALSQACFGSLIALNAYFIMDTILNVPEVVQGRLDRKQEDGTSRVIFWRDALGYVLPIAWGLPVIGATGVQASVWHDRAWMLQYCQHIYDTTGMPFVAHTVYLQVLASLAASYGSLFVTLRDKKLITKQQELVGISIFSLSAMVWTIYVTVVFYQHLAGYGG